MTTGYQGKLSVVKPRGDQTQCCEEVSTLSLRREFHHPLSGTEQCRDQTSLT